jgi:O-antigen/teichoic acid export membrane protein
MLKQATGTILSRVFVTAMNLLVMVLAGHAMGASGLGVISLIVLGITLVMVPANLIGGGGLVYLVPRTQLARLLKPAYAWAMLSCAVCFILLRLFPLVPAGYSDHVCALAFLQALYSVHLAVLIGQQRIGRHNMITAVHAAVLLGTFATLLWPEGPVSPMDYVYASYVAFAITTVLSALSMRWTDKPIADEPNVLRKLMKQGMLVQGANGLQLLNYRLTYWIIERWHGTVALGLYSVGNQLSESAWIAPRGLGLVLLSRVSNSTDRERQRLLTLLTAKIAVGLALGTMVMLAIVPDLVFRAAFGKEITGMRPIMLLLTPGILAMAASQAFSHYFSGIGQNKHNLFGSGLGMLVSVIVGFLIIPRMGSHGAAITASLAYSSSVAYQIVIFIRTTRSAWRDLLPNGRDIDRALDLWRSIRSGK